MGTQVAGGKARGIRLSSPKGRGIRPTTSSVRAAIFSILSNKGARMERVLDLYAGTGALGIEALSRSPNESGWADFVEKSRLHCRVLRSNLERLGFSHRARLYTGDVERQLKRLPGGYDLIFLDPPYGDPSLETVLQQVATYPVASPGAYIVVEHSASVSLAHSYGMGQKVDSRRYGDTCISIYHLGGE